MGILAVIPARGNSKEILRKNIRDLCGKPLIAWTIENALKAKCLDRIIVSTEDDEIAEISKNWGADVPFVRPPELSLDDTPGPDVILHAISKITEFDDVMMLQPTSPLRTPEDIEGVARMAEEKKASSIVSVCEASKHPCWTYKNDQNNRLIPYIKGPLTPRRQDLPRAYSLNGAVYWAKCKVFREKKTFIHSETLGYTMPPERSADIDTELDWAWVEYLKSKK